MYKKVFEKYLNKKATPVIMHILFGPIICRYYHSNKKYSSPTQLNKNATDVAIVTN